MVLVLYCFQTTYYSKGLRMTLQVAEPPTTVTAAAGAATVDRTPRPLRWASLTFAGIFAGFMLAVLVIESSLRSAGAATYVRVRLVELDGLDRLATFTLLPALVSTGLTLILARRARVRPITPFLVAVILLALVLVLSLTVNLPINA